MRVNNVDSVAWTPLEELRRGLKNLGPGQKLTIGNTKEEILRTQANLMRGRAEIAGADSHLEYIEALLIAEANGKLEFRR